jgi:hypothetical protein
LIKPGVSASVDDYTMMLAGLLPVLQMPDAKNAAVIGIGSGRTTHMLLSNPRLESVDTIEIEPAMVTGARQFGDLTHRAFDDPRSHLQIEDAKSYFARSRRQYDLIVAEPSNPWVSGVSGLFSTEFYHQLKRYMKPDGLLVQWVQLYEINIPLIITILKAVDANFADYSVYATSDHDILITARPVSALPPLVADAFNDPRLRQEFNFIDMMGLADISDRRIGNRKTLAPYIAATPWPANSDYHPILDQLAVEYRFLHENARAIETIRRASARLEGTNAGDGALSAKHEYHEGIYAQQAPLIADYLSNASSWGPSEKAPAQTLVDDTLAVVAPLLVMDQRCDEATLRAVWLPGFVEFGTRYLPYLSTSATQKIANRMKAWNCYAGAPEELRDWIALMEAAGTEDWANARQISDRLIAEHPKGGQIQALLARELLLADIRSSDYTAAKKDASRFEAAVFQDNPSVEYLRAYANAH